MKSTREMIEVMEAYEKGEEIECRATDGGNWHSMIVEPSWDWIHYDYRIKPKAQYRPWKPEEVPVGAIIRQVENPSNRLLITAVIDGQVWSGRLGNGLESSEWKLSQGVTEYSTDGGKTWSPCGVKS